MVLSSIAHVAKQQGHEVIVSCLHPDLYWNNGDVVSCDQWNPQEAVPFWGVDDPGKIVGEHQVQWMCRRLGLEVPRYEDIRCHIFVEGEIFNTNAIHPCVAISPFASWSENKNWMIDQWRRLVGMIAAPVYQLGGISDYRIPGAIHSYLGAPLRSVAALIALASAHICVVTGTMHLASAVGARSIVIYGGRENPMVTGYHRDLKLFHNPHQACAPCWLRDPCPYGTRRPNGELQKPCMDGIKISHVLDAIKEVTSGIRTFDRS